MLRIYGRGPEIFRKTAGRPEIFRKTAEDQIFPHIQQYCEIVMIFLPSTFCKRLKSA